MGAPCPIIIHSYPKAATCKMYVQQSVMPTINLPQHTESSSIRGPQEIVKKKLDESNHDTL